MPSVRNCYFQKDDAHLITKIRSLSRIVTLLDQSVYISFQSPMLIIGKFFFHFICAIGRFFRRIFQLIFGRRHDALGDTSAKTEPVTLEHIRIINDMENENHHRPYQSLSSLGKVKDLFPFFFFLLIHPVGFN